MFLIDLKIDSKRWLEKLIMWFVWKLPRVVIMWSAVRLMANATQGKWGNESPSDVNILTALNHWEIKGAK